MSASEPTRQRNDVAAADEGGAVLDFAANTALWRQFGDAATAEEFCHAWLGLQALLIPGIRLAAVILSPAEGAPLTPVAFWPAARGEHRRLGDAAERSLAEGRGVVLEASGVESRPGTRVYWVAYPVRHSAQQRGVVAVEAECAAEPQLQAIMRQLQWGAGWLENFLHREAAAQQAESADRMTRLLQLLAVAMEQSDFRTSAGAAVTELARQLGCSRATLGWRSAGRTAVIALSDASDAGGRSNLMRAIAAAMDEAADQRRALAYPLAAERQAQGAMAQQQLAESQGDAAVVTVPLCDRTAVVGALTFEFDDARGAESVSLALCEAAAGLLGPLLAARREAQRSGWERLAESARSWFAGLVGPGRLVLKAGLGAMAAAVLFFSLAEGDYRVSARTVLEGSVQRAVVAPINGYIKEALARAGDTVQEGQLMVRLEDRDLQLERLKWASEREQHARHYLDAMAEHDRPRLRVAKAQMDEAAAQLALVEEQLARTQIAAPFAGMVVSGDLSQSLGAPVERGQMLFQVAPLESYRVMVEVDERDVGQVQVGQRGVLTLAAVPGERLPFAVERLTPVSVASEGRNYFRVEARLEQASPWIRPGMEGVAKIDAGERKLLWIWFHPLIDWLRLWLWSWLP